MHPGNSAVRKYIAQDHDSVFSQIKKWSSHQEDGAVVVHVQEGELPPRLLEHDEQCVHEVKHLKNTRQKKTVVVRFGIDGEVRAVNAQ